MKKFFSIFMVLLLCFISVSYADEFDTNTITVSSSGGTADSSAYKYWAYYKSTGTRYVIRVYDWNSQKYIAVPKQYYINHIQASSSNQIMYLGVDKKEDGKYEVVKSGQTIFTDNTYSHVTKWYNNSDVSKFGLTKNDINLLAGIVKDQATKNKNTTLAKNMQDIIDGVVPYDVRAEILFLVKIPGANGVKKSAQVLGRGSIENYSLEFYANKETNKNKWRKEYLTYLECRAVAYSFGDDCGDTIKSIWLDKVACALYEKDTEYVFANGVYQCSCDWYQHVFGKNTSYSYENKQIAINQPANNPEKGGDRWYMYYTPGRCGIPMNIAGSTYYITPGQTYPNLGGSKVKVNNKIKYTNMATKSLDDSYLTAVTNDPTQAILYEGWDYITNKMAALSVIAVDKDTGNIIKVNDVIYSKFENVGVGSYAKNAWSIEGYEFLGQLVRSDLKVPSAPIGISNTSNSASVTITQNDVAQGAKKQIIFVYQKLENKYKKEARLSIYSMKKAGNEIMFTGSFKMDDDHHLLIEINDSKGTQKVKETSQLNAQNSYDVNTTWLEQKLGINVAENVYLGNTIKTHSDYFLTYVGEELATNVGNIYNLSNIGNNKVHIIIGYIPFDEIDEGNPGLKVSYLDDKGKPLPNVLSKITEEKIGEEITTIAEDFRKEMYLYLGYTYVDSLEEFDEIPMPLQIKDKANNVKTTFERGYGRRHIAFIYRKIELEFSIDIVMAPNRLANQLIGQMENEDYWVLDESGKVYLKVQVKGTEGLTISSYAVKLRIPFDTVMNGKLIPANSVNNLNVIDLSQVIVANQLTVPVWVKEGKYDIVATVEANVDGFGLVSANQKDDVEVVGRLYDFTVINLDGSSQTGDEKWKTSLFKTEEEYRASGIPIGQSTNQPEKYHYGIKLGTTFYFRVNTKGIKNNAISITPKFLYISKDGKEIKEVDIYISDNGRFRNILSDDLSKKTMKLKDNNLLKSEVIQEIQKLQEVSKVLNRYQYTTNESRNMGSLSHVTISKYLSLPYVNYINEFKELYGSNSLTSFAKTETELMTYASHWYGKYAIPATSRIVDKGASSNSKQYTDGYLVVCFNVISLDSDGKGYLSYQLPESSTQWQKEKMNQLLKLPIIEANQGYQEVVIDTMKDGYAPVMIYQVGISILDNNTSVGTH